ERFASNLLHDHLSLSMVSSVCPVKRFVWREPQLRLNVIDGFGYNVIMGAFNHDRTNNEPLRCTTTIRFPDEAFIAGLVNIGPESLHRQGRSASPNDNQFSHPMPS